MRDKRVRSKKLFSTWQSMLSLYMTVKTGFMSCARKPWKTQPVLKVPIIISKKSKPGMITDAEFLLYLPLGPSQS